VSQRHDDSTTRGRRSRRGSSVDQQVVRRDGSATGTTLLIDALPRRWSRRPRVGRVIVALDTLAAQLAALLSPR